MDIVLFKDLNYFIKIFSFRNSLKNEKLYHDKNFLKMHKLQTRVDAFE